MVSIISDTSPLGKLAIKYALLAECKVYSTPIPHVKVIYIPKETVRKAKEGLNQ